MIRCATCGYPQAIHEAGKCPVCACGDAPQQHERVGGDLLCACGCEVAAFMHLPSDQRCKLCDDEVPHACVWARWLGHPCPGRRSKSEANGGTWLVLRQGRFKPPPEPEVRREWFGLLVPVIETEPKRAAEPVVVLPPEVPARPPQGPGEFAGYAGKQAVGLGRAAMDKGWELSPWYWRAGDGSEGCAVRLAKGPLRAVATWKRAAGKQGSKSGWSSDVAYAWRTDVDRFPSEVTLTQLEGLI